MHLQGVRRQLEEARETFRETAEQAGRGDVDGAYRGALRARNLVFHAMRGLAAARGEPPPEMPVVGVPGGGCGDVEPVLSGLAAALGVDDDLTMPALLRPMFPSLARYLGWLRDEIGRLLRRSSP